MLTTSINVFAYDKRITKGPNRVGTHAVYSRSFPGPVPIPTIGESFGHLSWRFEVFDVMYTYLNDNVRVDVSVWVTDDDQRLALTDVR